MLHLVNHAFMKGCLFLVAGAIVYRTGRCNIRDLQNLGTAMPWTAGAFVLAAFAMIGIPPAGGFFSKLYLILGAIDEEQWVFVAVILLSSMLALAYFGNVIRYLYFPPAAAGRAGAERRTAGGAGRGARQARSTAVDADPDPRAGRGHHRARSLQRHSGVPLHRAGPAADLRPMSMTTAAWVCVFAPLAGALLTPLAARFGPAARIAVALACSFISAAAALYLLPALLRPDALPVESAVGWLEAPVRIGFGLLIDPLGIVSRTSSPW